jgi:isoquinoline 1-oxidoreductase beta subunit
MLVAEELDVSWDSVRVVQATAGQEFGRQGVGGSGTMRSYYTPLRQAGAVARAMLVGAAAEQWGVPAAQCRTAAGVVHHDGSSRSLEYGALADAAGARDVPASSSVPLKNPSEFTIIGQGHGRVDNADVVRGSAGYGLDARPTLPAGQSLRYAVVARPPSLGARLSGFDASAARAVPGVVELVEGVAGGVAVVAETTWAALQGREALAATWDRSANADLDSDSIRADLAAGVSAPDLPTDRGSAAGAQEQSVPFCLTGEY